MNTSLGKLTVLGLMIGLGSLASASHVEAAPDMQVGGQATARTGSSNAVVRVRVVLLGRNIMIDPVKVKKGGPPASFSKVVGNVTVKGSVLWKVGPTLNVNAYAKTRKQTYKATNRLKIKFQ